MYEFYNDVAQAQRAPIRSKNEKEYEYFSSYMVQHKFSYMYDVILSLTNNKLDIFVFIKIDRIEITYDSGSVIPAGHPIIYLLSGLKSQVLSPKGFLQHIYKN